MPLGRSSAPGGERHEVQSYDQKSNKQRGFPRHKRSSKKEKGGILDEFCALTGYNRTYAASLLRKSPTPREGSKTSRGKPAGAGRGRKPVYANDVRKALLKTWAILDCPCGKRLIGVLPETVKVLEKFAEIKLSGEVREKLLSISAYTADRLLAGERKKFTLKSRSKTKPGSMLKHQIPIETFSEWDDCRVGFL